MVTIIVFAAFAEVCIEVYCVHEVSFEILTD